MYSFGPDTVNEIYPRLISTIRTHGIETHPRGTTCMELHPAIIEISDPTKYLITSYSRPINVPFALAEVLWILQGRPDVNMLAFYNSKISQFSDDLFRFNAPYGYRLRVAHGYDQIDDVVQTLLDDRDSRQATLTMWHPDDRGWRKGGERITTKDRACNVMAHLLVRDGKLDWLHIVRSNDAILGVPYNWVQWPHVQQYIAARLGCDVGRFVYIADSMHVYHDTYYEEEATENIEPFDLYTELGSHEPMFPEGHPDMVLQQVFKEEEELRSGSDKWTGATYSGATYSGYWLSVVNILDSWGRYKDHDDMRVLDILADTKDRVLAAATFRFYYNTRWKKPKMEELGAQQAAYSQFPESVAGWICDKR